MATPRGGTAEPGLRGIQRHLERIYELDVPCDVDQFLTTDRALARLLDSSPTAREISEKLLLREGEDELDITLYLDAAVIEVLGANDPLKSLNEDNLEQFWTAF